MEINQEHSKHLRINNGENLLSTHSQTKSNTSKSSSKLLPPKLLSQQKTLDSFQSMDISDITLEIEKIGKLGNENPEGAIKDTNRLIKEIDQQMEMSFEIMEERQSMVLEYLREREMADKQSRSRADLIMKQFTTQMNFLEPQAISQTEKTIKSMDTQTDFITTKNQEMQTTLSESTTAKSKQTTERYIDIQDISTDSELDDKTIDENVNEMKKDLSIIVSSESKSLFKEELVKHENQSMDELRDLCRHMDVLESSLDTMMSQLKVKLNIDSKNIESTFDKLNIDSVDNGIDNVLKKLIIEKQLMSEDVETVKKLIIDSKIVKNNMKSNERKLKILLKRKFSPATSDASSLKNKPKQTKLQQHFRVLKENEDSVCSSIKSFQKDSLASVQSLPAREPQTHPFTSSPQFIPLKEIETQTYTDSDSDTSVKLNIEKQLDVLTKNTIEQDLFDVLKQERNKAKSQLKKVSEEVKNLSKTIMKMEKKRAGFVKNHNELIEEKKILETKLKELNKLISENLMHNERVEEKRIAEKRLIEVNKHIENLEAQLLSTSSDINENLSAMNSNNKQSKDLDKYLNELKNNLDKVLPFLTKASPKYTKTDIEFNTLPNSQDISDIIQTKTELSQKLLQTENQIQMIITSNEYPSEDDATITSMSEDTPTFKKEKTVSIVEEDKQTIAKETTTMVSQVTDSAIIESKSNVTMATNNVKQEEQTNVNQNLNDELIQLELQLHDIKTNIKDERNNNELMDEINETKKNLKEIQKQIKNSSQIPRPIEENKQIKIITDEIEILRRKCKEKGILNFECDEKHLKELKEKKKKYEEKVEQIKKRIENESINGNNIGNTLKDILQERNRIKSIIINLQEDIENLNLIKTTANNNIDIDEQLQKIECEILKKKSINVYKLLTITHKQISDFLLSVQTNLELQIEETQIRTEEKLSEEGKMYIQTEYSNVKTNIEQISIELNEINNVNALQNVNVLQYTNNKINGDLRQLLDHKLEYHKLLEQLNHSIEDKISTTHNKELLKHLLKKKIETKDLLAENNDKINTQKFILTEKLKKYNNVKANIESKLTNIDVKDIQVLVEKLKTNESSSKKNDHLISLATERESLKKNILQTIEQKYDQRDKIKNMIKVLDSMDAVIYNQLQTIVRKLNDINSYVNNFIIFTIDDKPIVDLLGYQFELKKILSLMPEVIKEELEESIIIEETKEIQSLEKYKKLLDEFHYRKITINDVDKIKQLKNLNEEKIDKLLNKIKSLNTLLKTQRKVKTRKKKIMQSSPNDVKILKITADKISRELDSLVKSYNNDIKDNEVILQRRYFLSPPSSEKKDMLNLLLQERDNKLHELFYAEKKLEKLSIELPEYNELQIKKDKLEKQIEVYDERIIEGDFSVTGDNETLPPTRSFSPKGTSSKNSFIVALDERDIVLKKLYELTKSEKEMKNNDYIINKTAELVQMENEKEALQNQLREIDDRMMEGATLEEDDSLNSDQTLIFSYFITNETLLKEIETLSKELKTGQLKLHVNNYPEDGIDIKELITDNNEKEIFKNFAGINDEIKKEKLKFQLLGLENEKKALEEELRGRKSPDRMLLKKEEQDIINELNEKEKQLSLFEKQIKIEEHIKNLTSELNKNEDKIEKEEEAKFQSFIKTEKGINVKNYKKDKIMLENQLDQICYKMSQFAKSLESEICETEKLLSEKKTQKNTKTSDETNHIRLLSPKLDDGLDALKAHQNDLKQLITNLTEMNSKASSEQPIEDLLKERSSVMSRLNAINEILTKDNNQNKETKIQIILKDNTEKQEQMLKTVKTMKLKMKIIDDRVKELKNEVEVSKGNELTAIKDKLGDELWHVVTLQSNCKNDLQNELKDNNVSQYITKLKCKVEQLSNINIQRTEDLGKAKNKLKDEANKIKELEIEISTNASSVSQIQFTKEREEELISLTDKIKYFEEVLEKYEKEIDRRKTEEETMAVKLKESIIKIENYENEIEELHQQNKSLKDTKEKHTKNITELQQYLLDVNAKSKHDDTKDDTNSGAYAIREIVFKNMSFDFEKDNSLNDIQRDLLQTSFEKESLKGIIADIKLLNNKVKDYQKKLGHSEENELLLKEQLEEKEQQFLMIEIENRELKSKAKICDKQQELNQKNFEEFKSTCLQIREEKELLMKDLENIQTKNEELNTEVLLIKQGLDDTTLQTKQFIEEIEMLKNINNKKSKPLINKNSNNINKNEMNNIHDVQNDRIDDEKLQENSTVENLKKELRENKSKMDNLWTEILALKEALQKQKEIDRKEKEILEEKLIIYIENLEKQQAGYGADNLEILKLKEQIEKFKFITKEDKGKLKSYCQRNEELTIKNKAFLEDVDKLKSNTETLKEELNKQKEIEEHLILKRHNLQIEMKLLQDENIRMNKTFMKQHNEDILVDIAMLKKDIIKKKNEIELHTVSKQSVLGKVFELQKLNVILEMKALFTEKELKRVLKDSRKIENENKRNLKDIRKLEKLNLKSEKKEKGKSKMKKEIENLKTKLAKKDNEVNIGKETELKLSDEIDRCKRIIFKRGEQVPPNKNNNKEILNTEMEKEIAPTDSQVLLSEPIDEETIERKQTVDKEVNFTMDKVINIITQPLTVEPLAEHVEYSIFRKEDRIKQERVEEFMLTDDHSMMRENKVLDEITQKENNAYEKEIQDLKQSLQEANLKVSDYVKEKQLVEHDLSMLGKTIQQLESSKLDTENRLKEADKYQLSFRERNRYLESEVSANAKTITSLNEKLEELRDHMFTLEEEITDLQEEYDNIKTAKINLETKNDCLQLDVFNKENTIKSNEKIVEKIEKDIYNLQNETRLKTEDIDDLNKKNDALNAKLKASITEMTSLKQKFDGVMKEKNEELESLKKKIKEQGTFSDNYQKNNEELQAQLSNALTRLDELNNENDQNESKIKGFECEEDEYTKKVLQLEKDKIVLQNKLTEEFEEKNNSLKELHESLKYALASKTKIIENNNETQSKLQEKINRLKVQIKTLEEENKEVDSLQKEIKELQTKLVIQDNEIEDISYENNKLKEEKVEFNQEKINLNLKIDDLKMEINSLEEMCGENLMSVLSPNEVDEYADSIRFDDDEDSYMNYVKNMVHSKKSLDEILKEIYDENKQLEHEIQELRTNLQYSSRDQEINVTTLENDNSKLRNIIQNLERKTKEDEKKNDIINQLKNNVQQMEERMTNRDQAILNLSKREEETKSENQNLLSDLKSYITKHNDLENEVFALKDIVTENEVTLESHENNNKKIKNLHKQIENENLDLSREKANIYSSNNKLKTEISSLYDKLESVETDKTILNNEIDSFKHEIKQINREKDALKKESETKSKVNDEIQSEIIDLRKTNETLQKDIEDYSEVIKKINREDAELIQELEEERDELLSKYEQREKLIEQANQRYDDLDIENHELKEKLKKYENRITQLEKEIEVKTKDLERNEKTMTELKDNINKLFITSEVFEKENFSLKSENKKMLDKNFKLDTEINMLKETIDNMTINKQEIQKQLEDLNRQIKKTNRERDILQDEIDKEAKLNETYEDDIYSLNQVNKGLDCELNKSKQTIDKQNHEIYQLEQQKLLAGKSYETLKLQLNDLKVKFEELNNKHQLEKSTVSKELIITKKKIEDQQSEINHLNDQTEKEIKEQLHTIKKAFETEKSNQNRIINNLKENLVIKVSPQNEEENSNRLVEFQQQVLKLETKCNELQAENQILIYKLKEIDESYEQELNTTRRQLTDKYKKNIDKLTMKSRNLSKEIIDMEKLKNQVDSDRNVLLKEKENLSRDNNSLMKKLQEKTFTLEEKERFEKIRVSTHQYELEGLRLENNELNEKLQNMKQQMNKNEIYKNYEKEIFEQKRQLEMSMKEFEEEKLNFEANIEDMLVKSSAKLMRNENERNEKYSLEVLRTTQEERDKLSNECINLNKELINYKNEIRKLKMSFKQKEEEILYEERQILLNMEKDHQMKMEETIKNNKKSKEKLITLNNEDRLKYEHELQSLKQALQEETVKQLAEQRLDFEKELKEHIYQYLKHNQVEIEELNDKNENLKSEKFELMKQFENERIITKRKYDSERYALVETIRRLLKNVMRFKAQRIKLKHNHKDEINDLEDKFEVEREKLEKRCEQEMELLRENLHRSYKSYQDNNSTFRNLSNDDVNNNGKYGPIRTKPEKESDATNTTTTTKYKTNEKLSLTELQELVKITDSSDDNNSDVGETDFIRNQYENELRKETDVLMKRLLEISDELDTLRSTT